MTNSKNIPSIAILRYHNNFELVKNRVALIKHFNPEMEVHGIYGGEKEQFIEAQHEIGNLLSSNFLIPNESTNWKWYHADITYQLWFNSIGKNLNFERAYAIEYDLLPMKPLHQLYKHVHKEALGCTALIALHKVKPLWFWTADSKNLALYKAFIAEIKARFPTKKIREYAMMGPGVCIPRTFLERLSNIQMIPGNFSDELKLHIWAQVLDVKVQDNKILNTCFNLGGKRIYFNSTNARSWKVFSFWNNHKLNFFSAMRHNPVSIDTIAKELQKPFGHRVFHPCYDVFPLDYLKGILKN